MVRSVLVAVVGLLVLANGGTHAGDPPALDLDEYIGTWQTEYEDKEGKNREIWTLAWNDKQTYIDFHTETWVNSKLAYVGEGFLFYAEPEDEYRMYLMMDNGALHESIGGIEEQIVSSDRT